MEKSYFDGGLLQLIGYRILGFLITVCTLGICLPWAYTMVYNWEAKHTVINGERLSFDGKAIGLFGNWIKWALLSIITLGIYSFWVGIKLKKWKISHTNVITIEVHDPQNSQDIPILRGESYFDGGLLQLIGYKILGFLVTVCTLGICYPWSYTMVYNWEAKHTVINGRRLQFDGKAIALWGHWLLWELLSVITFGIYGWWVGIKLKKWKVGHTSYVD